MRVRRAEAADLDVVCRLRVAFIADHRGVPPGALPPAFTDHTRSFVEGRHRAGVLHSWLAEHDGRAVGIVSVLVHDAPPRPENPLAHEGYIINLYVDPDTRRRGAGRALLDACLSAAGPLGFRRLVLHATEDGRPLYEQSGFTPNDTFMELPLPPPG